MAISLPVIVPATTIAIVSSVWIAIGAMALSITEVRNLTTTDALEDT
jgi:hypothetical protein